MSGIERVREWLRGSRRAVFFGGAGTSTESGIPDFRSAAGLYRTAQGGGAAPETILSHSYFMEHTESFFAFYKQHLIYKDAKPNAAHRALASLERDGSLAAVVTQNIDGLHQAAGSRNVFELHGSVHRNRCLSCGAGYTLGEMLALAGVAPRCASCGGVVKPEVVLYEEPLDEEIWAGAREAIRSSDLLIVGGTSLTVYPAAGLVGERGGKLVLINREETAYDGRADAVLRGSIGAALRSLAE